MELQRLGGTASAIPRVGGRTERRRAHCTRACDKVTMAIQQPSPSVSLPVHGEASSAAIARPRGLPWVRHASDVPALAYQQG